MPQATMSAIRFQTSSAVSERAVSETANRVRAQAVDLLTRRAEINRRIRFLQQVMQALRDLATNATFKGYGAEGPAPARTTERKRPGNNSASPPGHTVGQMWSPLPGQSKHLQAGLTRACRIALMEAANTASPDEIRTRIVRRGSFSFADSESATAAIIRTLNAMGYGGEVRRLEDAPQSRWQRIAPARESDTSI
jgi:hypothetical protein